MPKLIWWQWVLVALVGISVVNALAGGPKSKEPRAPVQNPEQPIAPAKIRLIAGKSIFAVTIDPRTPPAALPTLARDRCDGMDFCMVFAWTDAGRAARGFPMTDRENEALAYQYSLNRNTGHEESLWDCRRYTTIKGGVCIAR